MKRFRFSLQALLTLRQRQENAALEAHGHALQARQAAADAVRRAESDLAQASKTLQGRLEAGCLLAEANQDRSTCAAIEERRTRTREELRGAEARVRQTFADMLLARRDREIVDKLREHQREAYARGAAVIETKLLDEMALRRNPATLDWRTGSQPS